MKTVTIKTTEGRTAKVIAMPETGIVCVWPPNDLELFSMTPAKARKMAAALLKAADEAEKGRK